MCASSALRSSAFEGMHPTLRHTPPQYLSSTTATLLPSCAARMAATYPPGPAPRTTTSKCWLMPQSLGGEADRPRSRCPISPSGQRASDRHELDGSDGVTCEDRTRHLRVRA